MVPLTCAGTHCNLVLLLNTHSAKKKIFCGVFDLAVQLSAMYTIVLHNSVQETLDHVSTAHRGVHELCYSRGIECCLCAAWSMVR